MEENSERGIRKMRNREKGEVAETKTHIKSEVDSGNGKKRKPEKGGGKRNKGTNSNNTVDSDTSLEGAEGEKRDVRCHCVVRKRRGTQNMWC